MVSLSLRAAAVTAGRPPSVVRALAAALRVSAPGPEDAAAVALAKRYAALLDSEPEVLAEVGPKLLAALAALRLTPASRTAVLRGGSDVGSSRSALDQLRERRARRDGPEAVDAASS